MNGQMTAPGWQAHRRYWLQQFEELPPVLQLPTDYPRPAHKTSNGATHEFEINATIATGIRSLARSQDASVYMCLLAAVKVLLYHYSGQNDLVTGAPVAGRVHKDLEEQLGLYVNMLPVRTQLQPAQSFAHLLKTVKQNLLGAYEHQLFPFDQLVEALHLAHDNSRSPLTDVWVQHSDTPWVQVQDAGLEVTPFATGHAYSKVDLTVKFTETGSTINVIMEYNTDLFKESTIAQMGRQLQLLMEVIIQQPDHSLNSLTALLQPVQQPAAAQQLTAMAAASISNDY
jgi:non-ribosomal peptide synthetase component F